jgi:phosphotransferase system  glucose/maltose/N-acetylglucosamine-specific IIC component
MGADTSADFAADSTSGAAASVVTCASLPAKFTVITLAEWPWTVAAASAAFSATLPTAFSTTWGWAKLT